MLEPETLVHAVRSSHDHMLSCHMSHDERSTRIPLRNNLSLVGNASAEPTKEKTKEPISHVRSLLGSRVLGEKSPDASGVLQIQRMKMRNLTGFAFLVNAL